MVTIRRRFTGRVLAEVEGETLDGADLSGRDLQWANFSGVTPQQFLLMVADTLAPRLRLRQRFETDAPFPGDFARAAGSGP